MLKDIINEKQISVYKVSKESGVPYTTCNEIVLGKKNIEDCSIRTISSLANYLNVPIESLYKNLKQKQSTSWLDAKDKQYIFPILIKTNEFNISRIHPLKQNVVHSIFLELKNDSRIKKIIIFGSSTTIRCNKNSDVDIAIELTENTNDIKNEVSEKIQEISNYNSDIIWLDKIKKDTNIYKNINKGVKIYEQTLS